MAEGEAHPNPNPNGSALCEECRANPWKYRCPGCSIRTCSLPCVKYHKERTRCTGKRSLAETVPISQFDDNLLLSDYNYLEETRRVAESARRMLTDFRGNAGVKLPPRLRILRNAAYRRRTKMVFLSPGMSKREKNKSRFDIRKNTIFWTIEWKFNATDVSLIDHSIDEHSNLHNVLAKHLKPGPWIHQLKPYCDLQLEDLKLYLQTNPKGPRSQFRELNINSSLGKQMTNIVLVEYPIIHVYLPSHQCEFDVKGDAKSISKNEDPPGSYDNILDQKGMFFREEQIEEGELSSDTKVMDFVDYTESRLRDVLQNKNSMVTDKSNNQVDTLLPWPKTLNSESVSNDRCRADVLDSTRASINGGANPLKLSDDSKFDFEQELKDAYSDIMGEINPDDFLCLDSEFADEYKLEGGCPLIIDGMFMGDNELEEGEIPS